MMYKDNFSYLAFALILLIIARIFANKPFSLSNNLLLYICAVILISISRLSSIIGQTKTEAKDVCLFPLLSKGDILTNLCTPISAFKYPYT